MSAPKLKDFFDRDLASDIGREIARSSGTGYRVRQIGAVPLAGHFSWVTEIAEYEPNRVTRKRRDRFPPTPISTKVAAGKSG